MIQTRTHLRLLLVTLILAFGFAPPALAQFGADFPGAPAARPSAASRKPQVSAALSTSALQPGQQAALAVVLDVPANLHAQSNKPLDENLIPLEVKLEATAFATALPPVYPKPDIVTYPALGKLSVFHGKVVVYVPLNVKPDAATGAAKLSGTIRYQVCDDRSCFPPQTTAWAVETQVVPAGAKLEPTNPDLFKNFDPSVFARSPTTAPSTPNGADATGARAFSAFGLTIGADSYFLAFSAALLIGVVFNIMPCVLPVVPLKAMGFYQVAQHNRAKSMFLGTVFSLGIIATFAALAILVLVLKKFQWGQLFGNPIFAGAIVIVLLAMALQTFGVFAFVLPTGVYRYTPSHESVAGNFLFGIFTAILSTPCTFGMFFGLLIWASAQPGPLGVAVLMMVGVGMALPYFLLSAFPELARRIPRTGPWAEIVKQLMAFLLLATAVFFAQPFLPEVARDHRWWLIFAVIVAAGLFLVGRTLTFTRKPAAVLASMIFAAILVIPSFAAARWLSHEPIQWTPYSADLVEQARAKGQPVLIDFTADWCTNCKVLERTVLADDRIVESLKDKNVLPLKADLTSESAPGWALLRQLNPVGAIPLTVVYLPNTPDAKQLAGLYSKDDLLAVIE